MTQDTQTERAEVYLDGDPAPLSTSLRVEDVAARLLDVMDQVKRGELVFIRLPLSRDRGDALVRPERISAVLPPDEREDGEPSCGEASWGGED